MAALSVVSVIVVQVLFRHPCWGDGVLVSSLVFLGNEFSPKCPDPLALIIFLPPLLL